MDLEETYIQYNKKKNVLGFTSANTSFINM